MLDSLEKHFVEPVLELRSLQRQGLLVGYLNGLAYRELRDALVVELVAVLQVGDESLLVGLHQDSCAGTSGRPAVGLTQLHFLPCVYPLPQDRIVP